MMKFFKIIVIILTLILCIDIISAKTLPIKRKLICLYNSEQNEDSFYNVLHDRFEVILNYFGYYCNYFDANNPPENTDDYAGIVYWSGSNQLENPVKFFKWLAKNKIGKKIVLLGDIPTFSKNKDYTKEVNPILKKEFGFYLGGYWFNEPTKIKILKKSDIFDFEMTLSPGIFKTFNNIEITSKKVKPLLKIQYKEPELTIFSYPVLIAPWGAFGYENKIFYQKNELKRWIIDPFKFVKLIFNTNYPIPETTTINGKRILYMHIDGDGANSLSEVISGKTCAEVWYEKIGKGFPQFKIGVSFICADLDPKYVGNKRAQEIAKKVYSLPNVEPASHTYTHPLSWKKALMAYAKKGEKMRRGIYGEKEHIKAYVAKRGEVNHKFEILGSVKYLSKFAPKDKPVKVVYWSGDCLPTKKDLEIVDKYNLLAFNNGDTFFDLSHNSYSYVTPIGRDVDGIKQIYSSNSNENVYTDLWTDKFWGFVNVITTFKRTGYPMRIKPINLYYHFYSVEKIASFNALLRIYRYLDSIKSNLINIFPSQFIKIAKNFFTVKIFKKGENIFIIKNACNLKEFRFEGKVKIKRIENIKSIHYNKKLNVTYITIGKKDYAEFKVYY